MSSLKTKGTFEVSGQSYDWYINHFSGSLSAGEKPRPVVVHIHLSGQMCRELMVDYTELKLSPAKLASSHGFQLKLQQSVVTAIEQGWRPDSRGKPFYLESA